MHGGPPGWMQVDELATYRFPLKPSTSNDEIRPRPVTCARVSRKAKIVDMLQLSPGKAFEGKKGVVWSFCVKGDTHGLDIEPNNSHRT